MSFQKKNVILGFVKDDYVPTEQQLLVKYVAGKGNNLHEVECTDGSTILVSMPKKYRHTVWLKKEDCLVIDPIEEGKKVKGEIICLLTNDTVRDLIINRQWPSPPNAKTKEEFENLLKFFTSSNSERKAAAREDVDTFPPSDSSDMETDEDEEGEEEEEDENGVEEDDEEEEDDDGKEVEEDGNGGKEKDESEDNHDIDIDSQSKVPNTDRDANSQSSIVNSNGLTAVEDPSNSKDKITSRVQLVSSGSVTVTNVFTEGLDNEMQSLEFGADEEEDDEVSSDSRDLDRHANTIRIQVNYNKDV